MVFQLPRCQAVAAGNWLLSIMKFLYSLKKKSYWNIFGTNPETYSFSSFKKRWFQMRIQQNWKPPNYAQKAAIHKYQRQLPRDCLSRAHLHGGLQLGSVVLSRCFQEAQNHGLQVARQGGLQRWCKFLQEKTGKNTEHLVGNQHSH